MDSACAPPRSRGPAFCSLSHLRTMCPVKRRSGLFPSRRLIPKAGRGGTHRLPEDQKLLCGRAGEGPTLGPAAMRYVRAQGLRARMTDRGRDIPGGGGERESRSPGAAASARGSRGPGGESVSRARRNIPGGTVRGCVRSEWGAVLVSPVGHAAQWTRGSSSDVGVRGRGASAALPVTGRCGALGLESGCCGAASRRPLGALARRQPRVRALPL